MHAFTYERSARQNGFPCKDPTKVTMDDFVFVDNILRRRAPTTPIGSNVTGVTVENFPALNTRRIIGVHRL
ncbi:hypothetical protein ZOSMA_102G00020 [Zostera marina]|uniref:Uncharacterized protein n=1 Tax=Zostera marina TaxID=29655 RepID=A0A0K9Q5C6_ZOSMR|nr:hypothetical protein ZOSMA_102G00020 [Zostera marina]